MSKTAPTPPPQREVKKADADSFRQRYTSFHGVESAHTQPFPATPELSLKRSDFDETSIFRPEDGILETYSSPETGISGASSMATSQASSIASSARSSFSSRADGKGRLTLVPPPKSKSHGKTPGWATSLNAIAVRINIKPNTPGIDLRGEVTAKAMAMRSAPPLTERTRKKYPKTPPPVSFFSKTQSMRDPNSPSLFTTSSESDRTTSYASTSTLYEREMQHEVSAENIAARIARSTQHSPEGMVISIGVPAITVITPKPINAVRAMALRKLIFRHL
jgi:hypothetical protein